MQSREKSRGAKAKSSEQAEFVQREKKEKTLLAGECAPIVNACASIVETREARI